MCPRKRGLTPFLRCTLWGMRYANGEREKAMATNYPFRNLAFKVGRVYDLVKPGTRLRTRS
jgi:hypothetical protein